MPGYFDSLHLVKSTGWPTTPKILIQAYSLERHAEKLAFVLKSSPWKVCIHTLIVLNFHFRFRGDCRGGIAPSSYGAPTCSVKWLFARHASSYQKYYFSDTVPLFHRVYFRWHWCCVHGCNGKVIQTGGECIRWQQKLLSLDSSQYDQIKCHQCNLKMWKNAYFELSINHISMKFWTTN